MARNYKEEYRKFQAGPKQIKDRSERNIARDKMGMKKGDGKEVHHKTPLAKGGSYAKSNLVVTTSHKNRVMGKK